MEEVKTGEVSIRYNVSQQAVDNIEKTQAEQKLRGNKMSKAETADFMLKHFNDKIHSPSKRRSRK